MALYPDYALWVLFVLVAGFALIGAASAAMRTLPALGFLYRRPKQLAPTSRPGDPD